MVKQIWSKTGFVEVKTLINFGAMRLTQRKLASLIYHEYLSWAKAITKLLLSTISLSSQAQQGPLHLLFLIFFKTKQGAFEIYNTKVLFRNNELKVKLDCDMLCVVEPHGLFLSNYYDTA